MDDPNEHLDIAASVREELREQVQRWLQEAAPELAAMSGKVLDGSQEDTYLLGGRPLGVEELVGVLEAQLAAFVGHGPLTVAEGAGPAAQLAASWRAMVQRQVQCVVTLVAAGYGNEALANARTALEHAVLLGALDGARRAGTLEQFVADVRAGGEDRAAGQLDVLERIAAASGADHADVLASARRLVVDPGRPHRRRRDWDGFPASLFDRLADGDKAYSLYRQWSNTIHAGAGSAMPYLAQLAVTGSVSRVPAPLPLAETLATLVWCCSTADAALDGFLASPSLGAAQAELLARLGVGP